MDTFYVRQIITALFCLTLTACISVGPDYREPVLEVPSDWNSLNHDAPRVEEVKYPESVQRWWKTLNDPLLTELVDEALQASPDMRTAQSVLRESRARRGVARADYFPSLTASGAASSSKSEGEAARENYSVGLDASWELDLFGGVRRGVEASQATLEASEASLRNTQVSLAAEVATNYFEVRALQKRRVIALENLDRQSQTLQLTEWREQAGLIGRQDVEQARSNLEQTRAQVPSLEISLAEAEHSLEILLGKLPGALHQRLAADAELPRIPDAIAIGIPAETVRQRPDIRIAERRLAAETARVGVAESARYPAFKLSGSLGLEALTLSGLGENGAGTSSLLGGITAPLFNAGRLKREVEIQDAVREQAQITYEQTVLNALSEVENALVNFSRSQQRSEALARATSAVENAAEIARENYSSGLTDFQSVLDTERSVLSLQDSLATSRSNSVLALISLYKALGGGWSSASLSETPNEDPI